MQNCNIILPPQIMDVNGAAPMSERISQNRTLGVGLGLSTAVCQNRPRSPIATRTGHTPSDQPHVYSIFQLEVVRIMVRPPTWVRVLNDRTWRRLGGKHGWTRGWEGCGCRGGGQAPGATIGNGRATAIVLAREGAKVVVADRDLASAQDTVDMIVDAGGGRRRRASRRDRRGLCGEAHQRRGGKPKAHSTYSTTTSGRASHWATPWRSI